MQGTSLLLRWHGKGYEAMLQIFQCHSTHVIGHYITNHQQKIQINEQIPAGPSREVNAVMMSQQMQQLDQNLHYNTDVEPSTSAFQKPMTTTPRVEENPLRTLFFFECRAAGWALSTLHPQPHLYGNCTWKTLDWEEKGEIIGGNQNVLIA